MIHPLRPGRTTTAKVGLPYMRAADLREYVGLGDRLHGDDSQDALLEDLSRAAQDRLEAEIGYALGSVSVTDRFPRWVRGVPLELSQPLGVSPIQKETVVATLDTGLSAPKYSRDDSSSPPWLWPEETVALTEFIRWPVAVSYTSIMFDLSGESAVARAIGNLVNVYFFQRSDPLSFDASGLARALHGEIGHMRRSVL